MQANDYQAPDYPEHRYRLLKKTFPAWAVEWSAGLKEYLLCFILLPGCQPTHWCYSVKLLRVSVCYWTHFIPKVLTSQVSIFSQQNFILNLLVVQCNPGNFYQISIGVLCSVIWGDVYFNEVLSSFPVRLPLKSSAQEGLQSRHTEILPKYPE